MRVMAFASQKGGSGKTTLAGHIAVQAELAGAGPVAIIDTDPQGSLSDWWNARRAQTPVFAQTFISRHTPDLLEGIDPMQTGDGRDTCSNKSRRKARIDQNTENLLGPTRSR
jgi:cellulose biosynthesis protein BcsQ